MQAYMAQKKTPEKRNFLLTIQQTLHKLRCIFLDVRGKKGEFRIWSQLERDSVDSVLPF